MREELAEHEGVVGLGVVLRELRVLVHVERDDILESERSRQSRSRQKRAWDARKLALLHELDEVLVGGDRRAACGQAEHEGPLCGGLEVVDTARSVSAIVSGVDRRIFEKETADQGHLHDRTLLAPFVTNPSRTALTAWQCSFRCTRRRRRCLHG